MFVLHRSTNPSYRRNNSFCNKYILAFLKYPVHIFYLSFQNEFEEVDKIPTEGMKILTLFYTSKGVILIMSKSSTNLNGAQTKILRFNDSSEKANFHISFMYSCSRSKLRLYLLKTLAQFPQLILCHVFVLCQDFVPLLVSFMAELNH